MLEITWESLEIVPKLENKFSDWNPTANRNKHVFANKNILK